MTDLELGAFLSGPRNPEHEALLRLIGASILDPHGAEADDEPPAANTRGEWSDGELNELGDMLVRGVPMEEIARRLRRDYGEVRDKVAEVGQPTIATTVIAMAREQIGRESFAEAGAPPDVCFGAGCPPKDLISRRLSSPYYGGPRVRIHLPPAASLQTLSPSRDIRYS